MRLCAARWVATCSLVALMAVGQTSGKPSLPTPKTGACAAEPTFTCVKLALHGAAPDQQPSWDADWLERQLAEANRHFAESRIAFEIESLRAIPSASAEVSTAKQRDSLGSGRLREQCVNVFIVQKLADIDEPGVIRGVHWRSRDGEGRWIILADYAPPMVLAHELGHYFGLPHTKDPSSIMNKTPDPTRPAPDKWSFPPAERKRIARGLKRAQASGELPQPRKARKTRER